MIAFLDREEEKRRIDRVLKSSAGAFCCLYGRRRCGKTRLLRECMKDRANVLYYVADRSDRIAQITRFLNEAERLHPAFRTASGRDWSSALELWIAIAPKGSILVLDEFPYLAEQDEALPSILQRIVDRLPETKDNTFSCGPSHQFRIL